MAEYDLTYKIGAYLDRHLVFPILEFLSERGVSRSFIKVPVYKCILIIFLVTTHTQLYNEKDILQARMDLLNQTNMVWTGFSITSIQYNLIICNFVCI